MRQMHDPSLLRSAAFIDGQWIADGDAGCAPLFNPSTGDRLAEIPQLGAAQVQLAIAAADRAFKTWRLQSGKERSIALRRWYEQILAHADDLARLIVLEEGKPLAEARSEVAYAASFVEWFAEEAKRIRGDIMEAPERSRRIVNLKEPVGVCAAITPWNFPAAMITRKVAPALAAGCAMIVKPAEQTPLTAFALADLAHRAGLPAGLLNVVTGDPQLVGGELTGDRRVRKISFTGSTAVGRLLIAQSAPTIKKMSMELGGDAPFLVFDDADIDAAIGGLIATKYRNAGQTCVSANRIYVQNGIYDRFAEQLAERVAALKVGDGFEQETQQGPLISQAALDKVGGHVADALQKGARVLCGGGPHARGGLFFEPTVLTEVTSTMIVTREETFGPVAPLIRFGDEAEAIAMANDTDFGLAAYVFARDAERIWRVTAALETGMIGVNTGILSNEVGPFGGIKQSGLGREGSIYGIEEYLELKYVAWEGARCATG